MCIYIYIYICMYVHLYVCVCVRACVKGGTTLLLTASRVVRPLEHQIKISNLMGDARSTSRSWRGVWVIAPSQSLR